MSGRPTRFTSFDGTEFASGELVRPDRYRSLLALVSQPGSSIPRGAGLSYCAASAGDGVRSISLSRFNRILAFEPDSGRITVEPGLTVGELLDFVVPHGWYPPVLPGHPDITVGGCIGFDVHGKSQAHSGNFADCVESFLLARPGSEEAKCSRRLNPDLFELTLGAFGLTGLVTRATLELRPLPGRSVLRQRFPVANLSDAVGLMNELGGEGAPVYSWNDLNRTGPTFGRGIVYVDRFQEEPIEGPRRGSGALGPHRRLPVPVWNRLSGFLMTRAYGALERLTGEESLDVFSAAFPISGKELYFSLFGRRGFREYQLLVPAEESSEVFREVDRLIVRHGVSPTLGSLKLFKGPRRFLRFSGSGVCLAIDVPASTAAAAFFRDLDTVAVGAMATVNVAKDSRLGAETVRQLFPEYDEFRQRIERLDPDRQLDSALRRRLLD